VFVALLAACTLIVSNATEDESCEPETFDDEIWTESDECGEVETIDSCGGHYTLNNDNPTMTHMMGECYSGVKVGSDEYRKNSQWKSEPDAPVVVGSGGCNYDLQITFSKPYDYNDPVLAYEVKIFRAHQVFREFTATPDSLVSPQGGLSHAEYELQAGTYAVTVRGINTVGAGKWSDTVYVDVVDPAAPDASEVAVSAYEGQIVTSFPYTAISACNKPSSYNVKVYSAKEGLVQSLTGTSFTTTYSFLTATEADEATAHSKGRLQNGAAYFFVVEGVNSRGSTASEPSKAVIPRDAPSKITVDKVCTNPNGCSVSIQDACKGDMRFSWLPPAKNAPASDTITYKIRAYLDGAETGSPAKEFTSDVPSLDIAGAEWALGHSVSFKVVAVNKEMKYEGRWSDTTPAFPVAGTPPLPRVSFKSETLVNKNVVRATWAYFPTRDNFFLNGVGAPTALQYRVKAISENNGESYEDICVAADCEAAKKDGNNQLCASTTCVNVKGGNSFSFDFDETRHHAVKYNKLDRNGIKFTVEALTRGTNHKCVAPPQVVKKNFFPVGPPPPPSDAELFNPDLKTSGTLRCMWKEPAAGLAQYYTVKLTSTDGSVTKEERLNAASFKQANPVGPEDEVFYDFTSILDTTQKYTCSVSAHNTNGDSEPCDESASASAEAVPVTVLTTVITIPNKSSKDFQDPTAQKELECSVAEAVSTADSVVRCHQVKLVKVEDVTSGGRRLSRGSAIAGYSAVDLQFDIAIATAQSTKVSQVSNLLSFGQGSFLTSVKSALGRSSLTYLLQADMLGHFEGATVESENSAGVLQTEGDSKDAQTAAPAINGVTTIAGVGIYTFVMVCAAVGVAMLGAFFAVMGKRRTLTSLTNAPVQMPGKTAEAATMQIGSTDPPNKKGRAKSSETGWKRASIKSPLQLGVNETSFFDTEFADEDAPADFINPALTQDARQSDLLSSKTLDAAAEQSRQSAQLSRSSSLRKTSATFMKAQAKQKAMGTRRSTSMLKQMSEDSKSQTPPMMDPSMRKTTSAIDLSREAKSSTRASWMSRFSFSKEEGTEGEVVGNRQDFADRVDQTFEAEGDETHEGDVEETTEGPDPDLI